MGFINFTSPILQFHEPCPYSLCECENCENSAKKKTVEQELADLKRAEREEGEKTSMFISLPLILP